MIRRMVPSILVLGAVWLAVACALLLAGAGTAQACVIDSDGDCWHPNYHVQRTDGSLAAWSGPGVGRIVSWLGGNGTPVEVVCETTGATKDGLPYVVWDQLDDGTYVYGYYLDTPGDGYHPALTVCPGSPGRVPPAPGSVSAVPSSSTTIHVSWRDNSSQTASYVVSNGASSSADLPPGTTSLDWTVRPGTYTCFTIAAKGPAGQSSWSPYACATTPNVPWCPASDPTHPTCGQTGAFQGNIANDYKSATPQSSLLGDPGPDDLRRTQANAAAGAMKVLGWNDAFAFFTHYLQGTGSDLRFDAGRAYARGPGFAAAVTATVRRWVGLVHGAAPTFDSGWLDFPAVGHSTSEWRSEDWQNAVGHGFYRVQGFQRSDGSWSVQLQLTSYYQFRPGVNFSKWGVGVSGADMRRLEQIGWARNFREIGAATLTYTAAGVRG